MSLSDNDSSEGGMGVAHCESREGLWLQGEAAFETHSFRDAESQPVIQQKDKKIINCLPSYQTRPEISV